MEIRLELLRGWVAGWVLTGVLLIVLALEIMWITGRVGGIQRLQRQMAQGREFFGTPDASRWMKGTESIQQELASLEIKFYNERESSSILRQLSELARSHHVTLLTLRSRPASHGVSDTGSGSVGETTPSGTVPIEMVLEGRYRHIGDCLKGMRDEQPVLLEIRSVDFSHSSDAPGLLRAGVTLWAHLNPSALERSR